MHGRREPAYWTSTWATEDTAARPPARCRRHRRCFARPSLGRRQGAGGLAGRRRSGSFVELERRLQHEPHLGWLSEILSPDCEQPD
jgi:hypothetical protein